MKFLEKNLEDIIWENSQNSEGRALLEERGLKIEGCMMRQVSLGDYGVADLITFHLDKESRQVITIYELKKEIVCMDTLLQATRYMTACKRIFKDISPHYKVRLVGKEIDYKSDFIYLLNFFPNTEIYTYHYQIDGLFFEEENAFWYLKNEKFKDVEVDDIRETFSKATQLPF